MKDEELAKEYEENAEYIEIDDYGHKVYDSQDIEQAYLAGLKAGKEQAKKEIEEELLKCYRGYPVEEQI